MTARIELTGMRFGRLLVAGDIGVKSGTLRYQCICDCGNSASVRAVSLRKGDTKSCGCLRKEAMREKQLTHGQYKTPTYNSWRAMLIRCTDEKHRQFKDYGGRGIAVCGRWVTSFENFVSDLGVRPVGKTLDRIDVNGHYEPGNCKWSDAHEQNNNKRKS